METNPSERRFAPIDVRPRVWPLLVLAAVVGVSVGLGAFTFYYAKGYSYLTNDPAACTNCHIMREQYDGWLKGSHHAVAVCNDCHVPQSFLGKYATKASHGFWHSFYFTTQTFHEPIEIGDTSRAVTEGACRHCHADMVHAIESPVDEAEPTSCIRCHGSVGHSEPLGRP